MPPPSDDPTKTRTRPGTSSPRLLVFWQGGSVVRELRPPVRLVIGRAEGCDVHIPHDSVSRRHAVLEGDRDWRVEDLGSSNGTFLGGEKLRSGLPFPVGPGVVIVVGDARLVLDLPGRDAEGAKEVGIPAPLDDPMQRVERLVELVADSALPILVLGETGVGKGRLAEQIHRLSSRASRPFVRLNCAAVP